MYYVCPCMHDLIGKFKCDFIKTIVLFFKLPRFKTFSVCLQRNDMTLDIFNNLFSQFVFLFFIPNVAYETQRVPLWVFLVVFEVKFRNLDFWIWIFKHSIIQGLLYVWIMYLSFFNGYPSFERRTKMKLPFELLWILLVHDTLL